MRRELENTANSLRGRWILNLFVRQFINQEKCTSTDTLLKTLGEIVVKKSTDVIWKQGVNQNDTLIRFYFLSPGYQIQEVVISSPVWKLKQ